MLNISLILSALLLYRRFGVVSLAVGVLIGGVAQLALQMPALYRKGLRLKGKIRLLHPAAKRIGRLLLPRALGACVYQINIFVDTILASLAFIVGEGAVPALYYSNRIIQFPLAIFGIAMATAALPTMSHQVASRDFVRLRQTVSFSLRSVFLITVPAAVGLMVLGKPIIQVLFERGEFDAYSTSITSYALFFYAGGLFAYGGIKILVSCFYSLQDTLTPVKVASFSLLVNIMLNLILMWPLKIGGLALATAIAASVNFLILFLILRKKIGSLEEKRIVSSFLRILCAAIVMGISCFLLYRALRGFINSELLYNRLLGLLIPILGGILVYVISSILLKVEEIKTLFKWILRR
jgi:putative peptidoglycan lipid II flippase